MTTVTEMGAIVAPPMPPFYAKIETLQDMVDQTVARALDLIGIESPLLRRWAGVEALKK
jgi:4-hydroxy-3-polyprenylbenzoate decarboxylase